MCHRSCETVSHQKLHGAVQTDVITSYSIHYTKLYDHVEPGRRIVGQRIDVRGDVAEMRGAVADADFPGDRPATGGEPAHHQPCSTGLVVQQGLQEGRQPRATQDAVVARITSYNVCYTKLLRIAGLDSSARDALARHGRTASLKAGQKVRNNFV